MASAMIKCSFRSALRGRASHGTPAFKRTFASSAHHDEAREAAKWEKITYVGIITCTILAIVNLSKGHPHHEEPPVWLSYIRKRIIHFVAHLGELLNLFTARGGFIV
uniref:Cytochrome c oxidase subunit 6a, mitochondrial-like isoform X2 n=1 Tax=Nicotiana tabacum TaxID=4097 RepID=A0A1S3Y603_TOBAC|nr:PREDICTED: cytochrome c oxidase subunit 6a, mitochondrial-like isoform X2 [Nicotiana tabacum]